VPQESRSSTIFARKLTRRQLVRAAGISTAAIGLAPVLAASQPSGSGTSAESVKVGYVSPKSGSLAPFAEADDFILGSQCPIRIA
jgi:branched-chain amino acid transport system substrate-binding protein